jgi:hypothetical protein
VAKLPNSHLFLIFNIHGKITFMALPKEISDKIYTHPTVGSAVDCYLKSDVDIFGIDTSVTNPVPVADLDKGYTIVKEGIIFHD